MADRPKWAPLKLYVTETVMVSPQVLLDKAMEYLGGVNPRTKDVRKTAGDRKMFLNAVMREPRERWLEVIRGWVYVVDINRMEKADEGDEGKGDGSVQLDLFKQEGDQE